MSENSSKEYVGNPHIKETRPINTQCTNCGDTLNWEDYSSGVCHGGCTNYDGSHYETY